LNAPPAKGSTPRNPGAPWFIVGYMLSLCHSNVVLFESEPLSKAQSVAENLAKTHARDEMAEMIDEIDLELRHPTQNIRDILDNRASEEKCREFLEAFVAHVRSTL